MTVILHTQAGLFTSDDAFDAVVARVAANRSVKCKASLTGNQAVVFAAHIIAISESSGMTARPARPQKVTSIQHKLPGGAA